MDERFVVVEGNDWNINKKTAYFIQDTHCGKLRFGSYWDKEICEEECAWLNDKMELIEELHASDELGWKRAEQCKKKCPKELQIKKIYIDRLEYKVKKFKEWNEHINLENKKLKKILNDIMYQIDYDSNKSHFRIKVFIDKIMYDEILKIWKGEFE